MWSSESIWQSLGLSEERIRQCLNFKNKELRQVYWFKLLNWTYRCRADAMQLDLGCAPNFNERSFHFYLFFFNIQNGKLGQTIWNTALNYSHLLTWVTSHASVSLPAQRRKWWQPPQKLSHSITVIALHKIHGTLICIKYELKFHTITITLPSSSLLSSLSPKRNIIRKVVQKEFLHYTDASLCRTYGKFQRKILVKYA